MPTYENSDDQSSSEISFSADELAERLLDNTKVVEHVHSRLTSSDIVQLTSGIMRANEDLKGVRDQLMDASAKIDNLHLEMTQTAKQAERKVEGVSEKVEDLKATMNERNEVISTKEIRSLVMAAEIIKVGGMVGAIVCATYLARTFVG